MCNRKDHRNRYRNQPVHRCAARTPAAISDGKGRDSHERLQYPMPRPLPVPAKIADAGGRKSRKREQSNSSVVALSTGFDRDCDEQRAEMSRTSGAPRLRAQVQDDRARRESRRDWRQETRAAQFANQPQHFRERPTLASRFPIGSPDIAGFGAVCSGIVGATGPTEPPIRPRTRSKFVHRRHEVSIVGDDGDELARERGREENSGALARRSVGPTTPSEQERDEQPATARIANVPVCDRKASDANKREAGKL